MMKVDFVPCVNFTSQLKSVTSDVSQPRVDINSNSSSIIDFSAENQKQTAKTPLPKKTFKDRISDVWKFLSVTNTMVASGIKGLIYGAITGAVFMSGSWVFKSLPKAFTKEGPKLWDTIRHPIQHIGKTGKIIAGVAAGSVLVFNLIKGKLDANQNTAVIDHKLKTGHRDK